jgi:S-adenosylmethionine hydrolase
MKKKYFAIVYNPSTKARFAITDEDTSIVMYKTFKEAKAQAQRTLFGSHGYYEIFSIEDDIMEKFT